MPHLLYYAPFQIRVQLKHRNIFCCIVDDGAWRGLGSPNLVAIVNKSMDFDRRHIEPLDFIPQFYVTLGGNNVLIDFMVVEVPLDFNILLGHDYVYAMNKTKYQLLKLKFEIQIRFPSRTIMINS